jgi:hypothetical protein
MDPFARVAAALNDANDVWSRRREFRAPGATVPVAALGDIVAAKAAANRPKDRLFLATHAEELRKLLGGP